MEDKTNLKESLELSKMLVSGRIDDLQKLVQSGKYDGQKWQNIAELTNDLLGSVGLSAQFKPGTGLFLGFNPGANSDGYAVTIPTDAKQPVGAVNVPTTKEVPLWKALKEIAETSSSAYKSHTF
jgi:hypothetical protein